MEKQRSIASPFGGVNRALVNLERDASLVRQREGRRINAMAGMNSRIMKIRFLEPDMKTIHRKEREIFIAESWGEGIRMAKEALVKINGKTGRSMYPELERRLGDRYSYDADLSFMMNMLYSLELLKNNKDEGDRFTRMSHRVLRQSLLKSSSIENMLNGSSNDMEVLSGVIGGAMNDVEMLARYYALIQEPGFKSRFLEHSERKLGRMINERIEAWKDGFVVVGGVKGILYLAGRSNIASEKEPVSN